MQLDSFINYSNVSSAVEEPVLVPLPLKHIDSAERAKLQSKLRKLQDDSSKLEARQENLTNAVVDLRKLVRLVETERCEELEAEKKMNIVRQSKLVTLRKGL
jgi:predicted nuclease with TOPRIM domain